MHLFTIASAKQCWCESHSNHVLHMILSSLRICEHVHLLYVKITKSEKKNEKK